MKTRVEAACQSCGARMPRWVGRCPECGEWGTIVEERTGGAAVATRPSTIEALAVQDAAAADRMPTRIEEVDRVLGGGIVPSSVVLLAGEPGVGKSTLTLQIAMTLAVSHPVLLVCGEEAPQQVKARASRLGPIPADVQTMADPDLGAVLHAIEASDASVIIVDSIQTIYDPEIGSAPGSVSQVRECGARLVRAAREKGVAIVLVGHVTKEGIVAGPRVLEHLVDVVLNFEGDRSSGVRILRALKNRFGSTQDVGFFEMRSEGLIAIRDASAYLLADRQRGLSGSMLAACVDGRRPFVCEIQALINGADGNPVGRRNAVGVDTGRLPLLVAVLERHAGVVLGRSDVYVSAVGGIRAAEPACDLPITLAMMSSLRGVALPDDAVAFGEIGLSGEIRQVVGTERRLIEARSVGCKRAFVPTRFSGEVEGVVLHRLGHVRDALAVASK